MWEGIRDWDVEGHSRLGCGRAFETGMWEGIRDWDVGGH